MFFWIDLGSVAFESKKLRLNFRKKTVSKVEVIKKKN
jgi:hypothetical protein